MDTLQTAAPIKDLNADSTARPLMWFETLANGDETELDVNQPYQRGDVWGTRRRQLLIRSIMQGVPIGAIVVNDRFSAGFYEREYGPARPNANRNWAVAIIDGKQRFTTFVMWLHGQLAVPASWFPSSDVIETEDTEDGPYVRLGGLAVRQSRLFRNQPVSVVAAKVRTLAAEKEIFDLINFGGVAQGDTD